MLDFCAEHGITSDVEVIPIQKINEAYDRLLKGDVKYRFVIDMASLKQAASEGESSRSRAMLNLFRVSTDAPAQARGARRRSGARAAPRRACRRGCSTRRRSW